MKWPKGENGDKLLQKTYKVAKSTIFVIKKQKAKNLKRNAQNMMEKVLVINTTYGKRVVLFICGFFQTVTHILKVKTNIINHSMPDITIVYEGLITIRNMLLPNKIPIGWKILNISWTQYKRA